MGWRGSHKRRNANGPTGQTLALENGECQHCLALVRFQAAGVGGDKRLRTDDISGRPATRGQNDQLVVGRASRCRRFAIIRHPHAIVAVTAKVEVGITSGVEFRRSAQGLAGADGAGPLSGMVDDRDGDGMAAL